MDATKGSESENDGALLGAARSGDRRALERWLGRWEAPIYRFAMRMCRDPERAKDVLQESMLAAARTIRDFRGESSPSTWLFTIARSFCTKQRRKRVGEPRSFLSIEAPEEASNALSVVDRGKRPDEAIEAKRLDVAIADAIDALDPAQREVLVLRDVEGLAASEVGAVLGISVDAVKSRLHRARVAVRERVAPLLEAEPNAPKADGCPDVVSLLSRHLEGEIDAATCAEMERHLDGCRRCRTACDALRRTLSRCRNGLTDVPQDVRADVRRAIHDFLSVPPASR